MSLSVTQSLYAKSFNMTDSIKHFSRYECKNGDSYKFWEVHYTNKLGEKPGFYTRYGRIGQAGSASKEKQFANIHQRNNEVDKLIQSKLKKDYQSTKLAGTEALGYKGNLKPKGKIKKVPSKKTPVNKKKKEIPKKKEPEKRSAHLSRIKNLDL